MSINAHPDYLAAENEYLQAQTKEQKIRALKKMISLAPKHKGAENLRKQLKRRLARLKYANEKEIKKSGKSTKETIKKADMQAVIIGFTNSGKSSLLACLTNAHPIISENKFTTQEIEIGTMQYQGVQIQILDQPAVDSENFDTGIINTTDLILITITNLEQINQIKEIIKNRTKAKQIIIFNKSDLSNENQKRKISETLKSKKYNFALISTKSCENIEDLKEKIFQSFEIVRIYLKEPGKQPIDKPMILKPGATIKEVAEKIKKGLSNQVKQTIITGPSSKFPNQKVGLKHIVKDKDIIEFKIK